MLAVLGKGRNPGAGDRGAHKPLAAVGIPSPDHEQPRVSPAHATREGPEAIVESARGTPRRRGGSLLIRIEMFGHVLQIETGKLEPAPPEVSDVPQPMVVPAEVGFTIRPEADE